MKQGALIVLLLLLVALGLEAAPVLPLSVLRVPHAWVLPHKAAEIGLIAYYRDVQKPSYVDPDLSDKIISPAAYVSVGLGNWFEISAFGGDSVYFLHAKAALFKEKGYRPQIAIGMDNILSPVDRHRAQDWTPANASDWDYSDHPDKVDYEYWSPYLTLSKQLRIGSNAIYLTTGFGANRFAGQIPRERIFNGLFWAIQPRLGKNLSLALEYSGYDYNIGVMGYHKNFQIKLGLQSFEDLFKDNGYEDNLRVALGVSYIFDRYVRVANRPTMNQMGMSTKDGMEDDDLPESAVLPIKQTAAPEAQTIHPNTETSSSANPIYATRKALVIGNREYGLSSLKNPINDATAVISALREKGFEVYFKTDADLETMHQETERFLSLIGPSDEVLFYYSGHGAQAEGVNYLIPARAEIDEPVQLQYRAFNANELMDRLQKAHTSIVVLDACRDNPFRGAKSGSKGLAMATGLGNQMIIYSTAPGKTAEDGPAGGNSPFTAELVKHILNSDKQIPLMMQDVNSAVYRQTGGKQDPWVGSNLKTDFFFSRPAIIEKP